MATGPVALGDPRDSRRSGVLGALRSPGSPVPWGGGGRSREPGPREVLATGEALPAPPAALGAAGQRGAAPSVTF